MPSTSDAKNDLAHLNEIYRLYKDDHLQEFVDAAYMLLEQRPCISRVFPTPEALANLLLCDSSLILLGNYVADPNATLRYFQSAEEKYILASQSPSR